MAFNCPVNCPRVLHFSNPNVFFGGKTTGITDLAPDSAFNAKSLNNTALAVSNWRGSTTIVVNPYASRLRAMPENVQCGLTVSSFFFVIATVRWCAETLCSGSA